MRIALIAALFASTALADVTVNGQVVVTTPDGGFQLFERHVSPCVDAVVSKSQLLAVLVEQLEAAVGRGDDNAAVDGDVGEGDGRQQQEKEAHGQFPMQTKGNAPQ